MTFSEPKRDEVRFSKKVNCSYTLKTRSILMKKLRTALASAFLATCFCAMAEAPAGYYDSLNGKKDADLKTAVYNCIHNITDRKSVV